MKKYIAYLFVFLFSLFVASGSNAEDLSVLKVGATAGPHAEILEFLKDRLKDRGIDLQVYSFNDYITPNAALDQGDLDANSYQHGLFMDTQNQDRGYSLVSVAKTVVCPMGFYSKKIDDVDDLRKGAKVSVPNDPANVGRALALLEEKGFIKLADGVGYRASVLDVVENPKGIKFVEIEAPQLPRVLDDVDMGAVNVNYAVEAGLSPLEDAILLEDPETSPFANIIAAREDNRDDRRIELLIEVYHSDETRKFILDRFKGSFVPAW
ncbi:lipoprotein, YaeC family [Dethiosulfovibrio peptidovorans DSM 11002]|uniref:Lipoprotein n=1 Tax=Dethiosulfovibrio peptidovorans DSM 11002 TaxID=469381 RepID=D2Z8D8_9BACT|nr:MetQ/NlpA family ABC transporter substrate-binding protein [Dethiosulfovibrio peptidovorans]EFC91735.1 lipoprotein, YaeC family [Dethiosulfovibrio peptidovorans DSM 11002]